MCFGSSAADDARKDAKKQAQQAAAAEAKRKADIAKGNKNIDAAFEQYNPAFYDQYRQTYVGNYNPEIDRQYSTSLGKLMASLADRGLDASTVGNSAIGDVTRTRDDARVKVASDAESAAGTVKGNVERQKTNLYSLNQAAADPEGIKARAIGEASSLAAPPAISPLGDLFASILAPYAMYQQANQNSPGGSYRYNGPGASGSGSIVKG